MFHTIKNLNQFFIAKLFRARIPAHVNNSLSFCLYLPLKLKQLDIDCRKFTTDQSRNSTIYIYLFSRHRIDYLCFASVNTGELLPEIAITLFGPHVAKKRGIFDQLFEPKKSVKLSKNRTQYKFWLAAVSVVIDLRSGVPE